jgi:hypothetical protein
VGQVWWWVVPAVVVVGLLALLLLRRRGRSADGPSAAVGAVGSSEAPAAVVERDVQAPDPLPAVVEDPAPEPAGPATGTGAGSAEDQQPDASEDPVADGAPPAAPPDEPQALAADDPPAPVATTETAESGEGSSVAVVPASAVDESGSESLPEIVGPVEGSSVAIDPASVADQSGSDAVPKDVESVERPSAAAHPAPGSDQQVAEAVPGEPGVVPAASTEGPPARRIRQPADSALAALDSGLIGHVTSFGAAAAAVSAVVTRPGPHAGSALPTAGGSAPSDEYSIKANEGSRKYHAPDSPYYVRTRGDLWFRTAADAEKAGFMAWDAGRAT